MRRFAIGLLLCCLGGCASTHTAQFQGMFDKNTLTFNPGWDRFGNALPDFDDVREIQRALRSRGLAPAPAADESTSGPAFLMLLDPDGNPVLIDQHVPNPRK